MAVTFAEALKELKAQTKGNQCKRIKLSNGDVLEGTIQSIGGDMLEILMPDQGAGSAVYTVPLSSILYISKSELI